MDTVVEKTIFTPEDLLQMSDGKHYELVNGQLVEHEMSLEASAVALRLGGLLAAYVDEHELGGAFDSEASYQCYPDAPTKVRRPDVSFIERQRLRPEHMQGHCPIAPDLAVEVVSPTGLHSEVEVKIEEYLSAGVKLIWIVEPETKTVTVLRADGTLARLRAADQLSGESVVPGFGVSLERLFRKPAMAHPIS